MGQHTMNKLLILPALLFINAAFADKAAILPSGSAITPSLLRPTAAVQNLRSAAPQLPSARANIPSPTAYPRTAPDRPGIAAAAADASSSVHTSLARQASHCSILAQQIAVDFGEVLPAEASAKFTQRSYFEVDCPTPASYRLVLVDSAGNNLAGDSLVLRVANQPEALLTLSIDGRPPGKLMRHTGTQLNRHELLAELKNSAGQPLTPKAAGELSLPPNRFFVALVPAFAETTAPVQQH